MVLTKSDLIASLQNEVRILLHLAGKIDPGMLDYRPTPKQRSTVELLQYLTLMGPGMVRMALGEVRKPEDWQAAAQAAKARSFDETVAAIAEQEQVYASLLSGVSDSVFSEEMDGFGGKTTRGAFIVNLVLSGHAAYRTQLFLYLKANGHEELGTSNLWRGVDAPAAVPA
jgi:hypothetical protein